METQASPNLNPNPPSATYRFQFHRGFPFNAARKLVPYLEELGISHLYASPLFRARRGSLHGYSVTNPLELNMELGPARSFEALIRNLHSKRMGLILDMVPNHMALSYDNPWWVDVLENGQGSPYAPFFDIDWDPPYGPLKGKVLIPILGQPFGQVLESKALQLHLEEKGFVLSYYQHKFPLDPKTYLDLLTDPSDSLENELGGKNPDLTAWLDVLHLVETLPPRTASGTGKLKHRQRLIIMIKRMLWSLYRESGPIKKFIDGNLTKFNGKQGDPHSFDLLEALLKAQSYWLAFWRVSLELINYRRFFSINDLISIRVEDPAVFEATHALLFSLAGEGEIDGLRIDHIDGLFDPQKYLENLRQRIGKEGGKQKTENSLYLVVEDILSGEEQVPADWPVDGTTGYDFLNRGNSLLVDSRGLKKLQAIYHKFTGTHTTIRNLTIEKKLLIMQSLFGGEIETFEYQLRLLADQDRQARDVSRYDLLKALLEITACLPIYRTYIRDYKVSAVDRQVLEETFRQVKERNLQLNPLVLQFLHRVLLLDFPAGFSSEQKQGWSRFVLRWQQFTGPVMAKGLEDTALYVYNPLISLNEVGGSHQSLSIEAFHRFNQERQQSRPLTMNASSTHDTKRSEDVRARLNVLSEIPEEWEECLKRWRQANLGKKIRLGEKLVPDSNTELFFYQTLLGIWPFYKEEEQELKERLKAYLIKAAREAKVHTRWITPDEEYEKALLAFMEGVLEKSDQNSFLADFLNFQSRLAFYGALNSLSQLLLKITSPGIPDFYQGTEIWDFSLVDPDNRRPVDFEKRTRLLRKLAPGNKGNKMERVTELLNHWKDGRIKLYLTREALGFRKIHQELFIKGEYQPLSSEGVRRSQVISFVRRKDPEWVIVMAGRFYSRITKPASMPLGQRAWGQTALRLPSEAPKIWENILTGEKVTTSSRLGKKVLPFGRVFFRLPVALLYGTID
jgi:(1->4)-alpha-D-glucan 1-alpha-D-glucosylmutase